MRAELCACFAISAVGCGDNAFGNQAYWAHVKDDGVIAARFERHFAAHPERYAP